MKTLILFALLLATSIVACGQTSDSTVSKQTTRVEQELIGLNQQLIDALARGDKSVAGRIYADDFVRVTVQGDLLSKAQVLESLKTPDGGVKVSFESKDIKVIDYGNAAILVYLSIRHTDNKGAKSEFLYRVTDTFVKRDGRWMKAASVGTPIPQQAVTSRQ